MLETVQEGQELNTTEATAAPPTGSAKDSCSLYDGMQRVHHQLDTLRGREVLGGLTLESGRGPTSRLEGGVLRTPAYFSMHDPKYTFVRCAMVPCSGI